MLLGVAGLVVVAVVASVAFVWSVGRRYDDARHTIAQPFPAVRAPKPTGVAAQSVNLLLIGQDVDMVDPETPQFVGKQQADTLMLIHIPADRQHVYVMSILRNSLVPVAGHGTQAVNAAMSFGGVPLQVQTVEQLLGVRMDHVMSVDLKGMEDLTDALGGVTVENRVRFSYHGHSFAPGSRRLDGAAALAYVRGGDTTAAGDSTRARAQTAYLNGVLDSVFQAKTLLNPAALATAVSVVSPFISVDKGLDSAFLADLGLSLRDVRAGDVKTYTLPTAGIRMLGKAHVLELDQRALSRVREHLRTDTFGELLD